MSEAVNKEEIKKARQADLAQYLKSKGINLEKDGRRYRHPEHKSLVFTKNAYFWNSRQEHGNALDYVTKYLNMDFTTAVKELSQFNRSSILSKEQSFKIKDIELNPNMQRAVAYLNKTRSIDYSIIQDLIKNKLLYQSKEKSNIVFPIRNEKGNIVGAEFNGTLSDKRFKGIAENSEYGYGYNLRTSEIKDLKHYLYFESSIDMISYINIQQDKGALDRLKDCIFVSMGGLKVNIVQHTLKAFKSENKPNICLCVDNDEAGRNFCDLVTKELENENIKIIKPKIGKDWNEQLKNIKQAKGDLSMEEKKYFSYEEEMADRLGLDDDFYEFMKSNIVEIELTRDQARELQNLCLNIISKENELKAIETLDSSKMKPEAQINHSLRKLEESIKGNKHSESTLNMAKQAQDELSIVKEKFELNKTFIPVLLDAAHHENTKMDNIIKCTKDEIPNLQGYSKESQEKYVDTMAKRKECLLEATEKLNKRITGQQKKESLDQRIDRVKKTLEQKPQSKEHTQEIKHSRSR